MNGTPETASRLADTAMLAAVIILENGGETFRAEETAVRICRAAGKPIGIAVGADSAEDVRFWHDRGVQFISAGSDIATLVQHSRRQYDMMRSIFGNQ